MEQNKKPTKRVPIDEHAETVGTKKRRTSEQQARTKASDVQWEACEYKISAFKAKYPHDWAAFVKDVKANRSKYSDAKGEGLKQSQWRNVAAFPVIYRNHPVTGELVEVDALKPALEIVIPQLTHKKSVNFSKFLKLFPEFRPSDKSNEGSF